MKVSLEILLMLEAPAKLSPTAAKRSISEQTRGACRGLTCAKQRLCLADLPASLLNTTVATHIHFRHLR